MRSALIVLVLSTLAYPAEYDPGEVLRRAAERVEANFLRTPKYTCVETVTREYYRPWAGTAVGNPCSYLMTRPKSELRLATTDRLRIEVTMAKTGEIYSWLGASQFNEGDITQVITHGPIATGAFGASLAMVFRQEAKYLHFERDLQIDGRRLLEFSYYVDSEESRYRVKTLLKDWYRTAYHGEALVDPVTGDVVRLTLATGELPPVTGSCQTVNSMDYARQKIGDEYFMLPSVTQQRFIGSTGRITENAVTFSGCRAYGSESTVTFFDEPPGGTFHSPGISSTSMRIPPNLRFSMELTTAISSDTAAAGDAFQGRLLEPLRDGDPDVLAPQGAVVNGRLLQVQIEHGSAPSTILVMGLRSIQIGGDKVPLAAFLDLANRRGRREMILPEYWQPDSGIFQFPGDHVTVPSGFRSDWRTAVSRH